MHPLRKKLMRNPVIKALASIKITVVCLALLFILTLWGTIDQVQNGLYLAQARFFNSWVFTFWGFVPFPGARLVLWVFFVNLVCAALIRLVYRWSKAGIVITHFGLLLFFVGAFVTFHGVQEANITFLEGEVTNISSAYHNWELSVWTKEGDIKKVVAYDADHLQKGQRLDYDKFGLTVTVDSYYRNAEAFGTEVSQTPAIINNSGITMLKSVPLEVEPVRNSPGGIFDIAGGDQGKIKVLFYGRELGPFTITKDGKTYFMQLRLKRFPIPFRLKLKDFIMEKHPNTEMARKYQSLVDVISGGASREVLISMNEPLRHKNYTMYQSSYSIDRQGRERSTLAVVKNTGRLLPYIATFVTTLGLAVHLLLMAFESKRKKKRKA